MSKKKSQPKKQQENTPKEEIIDFISETNMPADKKEEAISAIFQSHTGPLPPPEQLKEYEQILPDIAERLMRMAEKEQDHRHNIDLKNKELDHKYLSTKEKEIAVTQSSVKETSTFTKRGQIFAFLLAIIAISGGIFLTLKDHSTVGGILLGSTVVGLASAFLYGKGKEQKASSDQVKSASNK